MRTKTPLRTETVSPPQQRGTEIGWFPYVETQVSFWYNGQHLKDVSKWTNLDAAIEAAARQVEHYCIEPGCGLVVAVTLTRSERVKVWNGDYGWSWPSSGSIQLPRPVTMAQGLVWTSDRGLMPAVEDERVSVRLRFRRRFAITGKRAAEQDLTPLFSVEIDSLDDHAMVAGLSHKGLEVSGLSIRNTGPDSKVPGVFWTEAVGEISILADRNLILEGPEWGDVRNGVLSDVCAAHLRVNCFPVENHTHWATRSTGSDEISWEVISITMAEDNDRTKTFNETNWRAECEALSKQASVYSSQSHSIYMNNFSAAIDSAMDGFSEADHLLAINIAREWDYATPEELKEDQSWNAENGFCSHGIELGCCPAGCGSV